MRAQNARAEAEEIEKDYKARERRRKAFEENEVKLGIDGPPPAQRQRIEGPGEAAPAPIEPTERQNDKIRPIDDFNSTEVAPDGYQRYVCSKIDCDNKWAGMKDSRPVVCGDCGSDWQIF